MRLLRPCLAALLALWLVPAAAAGEVRTDLTVPSAALGRELPYSLYLPDAYAGPDASLPVLYLLHGLGGTARDWIEAGRLEATLDGLIAADEVPPMLVVMPGAGDGWYVDNPDPGGVGRVATALLEDLIPAVEGRWATGTERRARAIVGLSMGGWGAMRLALDRPDLFVAAASLSGALVPEAWAGRPLWIDLFRGAFGRPFDPARFRTASPFTAIERLTGEAQLPRLLLVSGDDDELELATATFLFWRALQDAGIDAELRITDGGHNWTVWARDLELALRFAGAAFSR